VLVGIPSWATPAAVLLGALAVALAVRGGFADVVQALEHQPACGAAVPGPSPAVAPASLPSAAGPVVPGVGTPASDPAEAVYLERDQQARLRDDVTNAIYAQLAEYRKRCPPSVPPGPGTLSSVEITVTIDAAGAERAREFRGLNGSDEKLMTCLRAAKLQPVHVAAPDKERTVPIVMALH
jgi:hypothetical protein